MGLRAALTRLAARAATPVFVVRGMGSLPVVNALKTCPDINFVRTPRQASVLVVAGTIPATMYPALLLVHDQLAPPRGVVLAMSSLPTDLTGPGFHRPVTATSPEDAVDAVIGMQRDLLYGSRPTSLPLLPDTDPTPWRGVGPYGQGGKGMTGGTPFGRPMPTVADDRDGLKLDRLNVRIGPFLPFLPPGLAFDMALQGDLVQEVALLDNPFRAASTLPSPENIFVSAIREPVAVRELEFVRAAHHLRYIADVLDVHGLSALGRRAWDLSTRVGEVTPAEIRGLRRLLERQRSLEWATRGVACIPGGAVADLAPGPVARACGVPDDHRTQLDEYHALGFRPAVTSGGDACARWRLRLKEVEESLRMARLDGAASQTGGRGRFEAPWGTISQTHSPMPALVELLPVLLRGVDWGDAVSAIVSLGIDLEEAARV